METWRDLQQKNPPRLTGTWVRAEGGKGGSAPERERHKMQAHGAGRRGERRRLDGGRFRRCPGERRSASGEDVGIR